MQRSGSAGIHAIHKRLFRSACGGIRKSLFSVPYSSGRSTAQIVFHYPLRTVNTDAPASAVSKTDLRI